MVHAAEIGPERPLPFFASLIAAGFPSPAEDYVEGRLDLNERLVRRPAATFIVRVQGESMTGAGIYPNDLLVVDRSLEAKSGDIVIAVVDGELTVKRLRKTIGEAYLTPENPAYPRIKLEDGTDCVIWGVVASAIREFHRR